MSLPCPVLNTDVDCEAASELLSAWIDGELGVDEARALDDHLAACTRCAAERKRLEAVRAVFRSVTPVAPPERIREEVLARIRREERARGRGLGGAPVRGRWRVGLRSLLTAAALLLAAAGTVWWTGVAQRVPAETATPAVEGVLDASAVELGVDAGCGPDGDCTQLAPCDSPAECGGGPPCSNPGECDGGLL